MPTDTISVIVPVYRGEKTLENCVNSITAQTYSQLEIILVDDGSPDGSGKICDLLSQRDKRIKVIHKQNGGVSSARNEGLIAATGKYVQFADCDDRIEPDMCRSLITAAENTDTDMVICGYIRDNGKVQIPVTAPFEGVFTKEQFGDCLTRLCEHALFNSPCNKLYRREKITGGFNPAMSIGEDLIFNLNYLSGAEKIFITAVPYYIYDITVEGSLAKKARADFFNEYTLLYNQSAGISDSLFGKENAIPFFRRIYVTDILMSLSRLIRDSAGKDRKKILDTVRGIYHNDFFMKICAEQPSEAKQHQIGRLLLLKGRVGCLYAYYRLLSRLGKVY